MGGICMICRDAKSQGNSMIGVSELTDPFYRLKHAVNLDPEIITAHGPSPGQGQSLAEIPPQMEAHFNKANELHGQHNWLQNNPQTYVLAPYRLGQGNIYFGAWLNHMRHGNGVLYFPQGSSYEGQWNFDKAEGKGRLYHKNGDLHTGEYKNNKADGIGTHIYNETKVKFTGNYCNDQQNGPGREDWPDGTVYEGDYRKGKKNGFGKFMWSDGSVYIGDFVDDVKEGYGECEWKMSAAGQPGQRTYKGGWKNGLMHGKGEFTWADKRRYIGTYNNDVKEGYGIFQWPDGRVYEGQWKDGKMHGKGRYRDTFGKIVAGIWQKSQFIKPEL